MLERLRPPVEKLRKPSFAKLGALTGSAVEKLRQVTARRPKPPVEPPEPVSKPPVRPIVAPPLKQDERRERPPAHGPAQTWLKPKAFQFNEGRVEISVSWQAAVFIALAIIFILVVTFQLGRVHERARFGSGRTTTSSGGSGSAAAAPRRVQANVGEPSGATGANAAAGMAAGSLGDHVIVLAHYATQAPLVPVKEHFEAHGISTGIVAFSRLREHLTERGLNANVLPQGDGYMLITTTMYHSPKTAGTDGDAAKERIKEVGALYKGQAPEGYEPFAPHYFSDAYGMKIR